MRRIGHTLGIASIIIGLLVCGNGCTTRWQPPPPSEHSAIQRDPLSYGAVTAKVRKGETTQTEPDFFIGFFTCKLVIAPLTMTKEPLQVGDADPLVNACTKKGERITCQLSFESGAKGIKGNIGEYIVEIDVPPILVFKDITGQEYIIANTTSHAAVMSSLVLDPEQLAYAGSKVCHGVYMTNFEYKNLKKNGNP